LPRPIIPGEPKRYCPHSDKKKAVILGFGGWGLHAEEVSMQETKRMAEDVKRVGYETREQARKIGQDYQDTIENGVEAVSRSFSDMNRGFQAVAAEMTEFSKNRIEEVMRACDQLIRARTFGDVVEAQSKYVQKAVDAYMVEWSKIRDLYLGVARNAAKPLDPSKE
jgi:hypothetical protein